MRILRHQALSMDDDRFCTIYRIMNFECLYYVFCFQMKPDLCIVHVGYSSSLDDPNIKKSHAQVIPVKR